MIRCTKWMVLCLTLVCSSTTPRSLARPATPQEPALVVQAKSINGILADLKYIAQLVDRGDQVDQLDGVIAAVGGPQGLAGSGLDVDRPFLAYLIAAPGGLDSPFAVMVPVSNEQTLLTLLGNFSINPKQDNHGIYSVDIPGQPTSLHFKFANKYVYITAMEKGYLDDERLIAPEKLVSADRNLLLGVSLRIDQIPDQLKQLILGQLELQLSDIKDRTLPGESQDQKRMRQRGIDAANYALKAAISEGKSLDVQFAIDRDKDDLKFSIALDGKTDTSLAKYIALFGEGKSRLAVAESPALHMGVNLSVPEAFRSLVELAAKDAVERQTDPVQKEIVSKLYAALLPTLQRGELDAHVTWFSRGDSGPYTAVAGIAVENGEKIEAALKDAIGKLPADGQKRIKLDSEKTGEMHVHQILLDRAKLDKRIPAIFGIDPPNLWTGFGTSAVMLGMGSDPVSTFKGLSTIAQAHPSPALIFEAAVARLAPLDESHTGAAKLAQTVFAKSPKGSDVVRLSLDGGKNLKFSASFKGLVLRFFYLLQERRDNL